MAWILPERGEVRQPKPQKGAKSKPCEPQGDTFFRTRHAVSLRDADCQAHVSAVGSGHALTAPCGRRNRHRLAFSECVSKC